MIIGLTGGIGSGKSTVAELFSNFDNVAVYIADIEAKRLMNNSHTIKKKLISLFGEEAYAEDKLNRKFISNIVFTSKEKLEKLNAIVHPEVKKHFQNFVLKNKNTTYILYENAILFETKSNEFCNFIITVYSDIETRVNRVVKRDKTTKKEVLKRINNQWKEEKKILQSNYIIQNTLFTETEANVSKIHNILTKKRGNF